MRNFFQRLGRAVSFPFVLLFNIIAYPFRLLRRGQKFLNTEPEDRPLVDTFTSLATDELARQSLWEHVDVLRRHLLRIIIGITLGVAVSFYFTNPVMEYLALPVGGLAKLQAIRPTEEIGVYMRVALTSGIAIMLPYIAFEIWLFLAPGLRPRENRMVLIGIPFAALLFFSGMAFTFYVMLPTALPFLGNLTAIEQQWTANDYFGFITGLMLWIGLFFEFPLIIYLLTAIGFVKPEVLSQQWRIAVVVIAIIAAAVTPTIDPVNMGLVMLPMILLYFVSIGLSQIAYAGRRRNQAGNENATSEI